MSGTLRILIVDDDRRMASTLADILNLQGYQTHQSHSPEEALELARSNEFDCVISDMIMPGMNGSELCHALSKIQPNLPSVLMTAYASEQLTDLGLKKGALAVLEKPLDITQVLQFLTLLRETQIITIVDDDSAFAKTLGSILERRKYSVSIITDPQHILEGISGQEQVILLDMKLNSVSGHEVLKRIRVRYPELPVLLVTGYGVEMAPAIEQALATHAYACLYKPLVIPELLSKLAEIRSSQLKKALAHT